MPLLLACDAQQAASKGVDTVKGLKSCLLLLPIALAIQLPY